MQHGGEKTFFAGMVEGLAVGPETQGVEQLVVAPACHAILGQPVGWWAGRQVKIFGEVAQVVCGSECFHYPAVMQRVLGQCVGEGSICAKLPGHFVLQRFKIILRLAAAAVVVCHRGDEPVQVMAMAVGPVGGDDGRHWDLHIFKPAGCTGEVQVKAHIGAVHGIESAVGELADLLALAKAGAFGEVVSGHDGFVEVGVEVLELLVHPCLLVVVNTTKQIKDEKSNHPDAAVGPHGCLINLISLNWRLCCKPPVRFPILPDPTRQSVEGRPELIEPHRAAAQPDKVRQSLSLECPRAPAKSKRLHDSGQLRPLPQTS